MRDAVVIGGGIAGLAAAWDLRNRDVVVLEGTGAARRPHPQRAARPVLAEPRRARLQRAGLGDRPARRRRRRRVRAGARPPRRARAQRPPARRRPARAVPAAPAAAARPSASRSRAPGARLRVAVARYERVAKPRPGESPAETRRRLLAHGDDRTFSDWLGELPGDADLMFRATVTRSTAEPEEITAGAGTGYFALVWSSGVGPLAQHRRRRRRADRRHRRRAARADRHRRRRAGGRGGGRPRARALPLRRRRPRAARAARDRRHQGLRRRAADPRPARPTRARR